MDEAKQNPYQMRVYSSGKGTFDEVVRSYRLAQQHGVKTGVCVTIDRHNLFRMKETVRWLADELGAKGMGFNILIENTAEQATDERDRYAEIVAQELIDERFCAHAKATTHFLIRDLWEKQKEKQVAHKQ